MGDIFHQTNAQQTATNQQIGISTRDVGGSVTTAGAGASVSVQSLDPAALNVAGAAVTSAIQAVQDNSAKAMEAYQQALTIAGETTTQAQQLAASGVGSGANVTQGTATSLNPSTVIWVGGAIVAILILSGRFGK